jgi:hypothetical protein
MRTTTLVVVAALTAILAASALAAGNTPSASVYHPKASQVQGVLGTSTRQTETTATAAGKPATGANLPFTGLDLAFVLGASVVLVGAGYSLRRVTRKPPAA